MKLVVSGVSVIVVALALVCYLFRAEVNVVHLCFEITAIEEQISEVSDDAKRQITLASAVSSATYTEELDQLFAALAQVDSTKRSEMLTMGLAEIMGESYSCPALDRLFAGSSSD